MNKKLSNEHKKKISESIKEWHRKKGYRRPWNKGKKTPENVKEKQKLAKIKNPVKYWEGKKRDRKTINAMQEGLKKYNVPKGKNHHSWKGGCSQWWHDEARKIMAKKIGRKLKSTEIVHHIDGDYTNNDVKNLVITNRS